MRLDCPPLCQPGILSDGGPAQWWCRVGLTPRQAHVRRGEGGGGGGGLAQGLGIRLFAFGGTYWPLATAHSDPLWARTCSGCVRDPKKSVPKKRPNQIFPIVNLSFSNNGHFGRRVGGGGGPPSTVVGRSHVTLLSGMWVLTATPSTTASAAAGTLLLLLPMSFHAADIGPAAALGAGVAANAAAGTRGKTLVVRNTIRARRPCPCPIPDTAPDTPCVTFRRVVVPLRGPGRSPVLPFACCVVLLLSVGRCGRCSCWCRFRVRGAQ